MDNNDDIINDQSLPDLNQESEPTIKDQPTEEKVEPKKDTQPDKTEDNKQRPQPKPKTSKTKKNKWPLIVIIILFVLIAGTAIFITVYSFTSSNDNQYSIIENEETKEEKEEEKAYNLGDISISGNDINDFDLAILKLEDDKKNIIYSPLSIKYALAMLNEGTGGSSKEQIEKVIGTYVPKKYTNSANLSLANSLFINSNHKDEIKEIYKTSLQNKYNAELVFDTFETPDTMNSWIEDKTLGLIKNTISETDPIHDMFYLINALGIDMEWKQKIGADTEKGDKAYSVYFKHIAKRASGNYASADNEGAQIAATAFKYDFIKELGEDGIKNKVQEAYDEWVEKNKDICSAEKIAEYAPDLDEYVNTLSSHYGHFSKSTDFEFYDDDNVQLFAKDLKEYDGTTLQYVGIMPKSGSLGKYIKNVSAAQIGELIGKLKPVETENFDEGIVTILNGYVPFFNFDYQPEFKEDLIKMGITDIFNDKANMEGISDTKGLYITNATHKANIDFSNEGIKAGAVTVLGGGLGGAGDPCQPFFYDFEVPTKEIELRFRNPFLFLIRDRDTGEIWFIGSVYEPNQK